MKKYTILLALALLVISSCKTKEDIIPEIKVSGGSAQIFTGGIQFEAEAPAQPGQGASLEVQTRQIQFTATDKWTADVTETKASSWLSVEPVSGPAGDVTLTVIARPNTTPDARRATVTIRCGTISKSFTVSQEGAVPVVVAVTGISISPETLNLEEGETVRLTATVEPDNATDKTVSWKSSDSSVATVDDNGLVTALAEGTARITATCGNAWANCQVTVSKMPILVTGIEIDRESLNLAVGSCETLVARVLPEDATDQAFTWASTNETIATVDANGKVTAVATGTVTITATTTDGGFVAACEVTVYVPFVAVESITLDKTEIVLEEGDVLTLTATVKPDDASNPTVTWSTSDAAVATVEGGRVTAVAEGAATITAKAGDLEAACSVTVSKKYIPVASITLNKTSLYMIQGDGDLLVATVKPDDATNPSVSWSTSNGSVASVEYGVVMAGSSGTAIITATAENLTATCEVFVTNPIMSLDLNYYELDLLEGESAELVAFVTPPDADELPVEWRSDDEKIAKVDAGGMVTAVSEGIVEISAICGNFWRTCVVTVRKKTIDVTGVALNNRTISLIEGETASLVATVSPANATDKSVIWSTSDASVAEVDNNGNVYANTVGSAVITVTTNDGGKSATCEVTVISLEVPVVDIYLNTTSLTLTKGASESLIAIVEPDNATNPLVFWASSDDSVATVREGTVTAIKSGKATIYASAEDKTATCEVTVITPVTGISLDCSGKALTEGESFTLKATVEPADADDKTVSWTTSNASVATVENGVVTAVASGEATITAKCADFSATCAVTVAQQIIPVTSVSLNQSQLNLEKGGSATLVVTVGPDDATNKTVTWTTSDASVATVENGVVTAVGSGTATITAECGGKQATCTVKVVLPDIPVQSISLNKTSMEMAVGEWYTITVNFNPSNATDKSVTWTSSNPNVAQVTSSGKVMAQNPGTTTITANASGKTATCAVTVAAPPVEITGIALDPDHLEFYVGESATVNVVYYPEDATPEPVSWTWYGTSYATIEEGESSCTLTGIAAGSAYLYAQYGSTRVGCEVYVRERPVQRTVTVSPTSMTLDPGEEFALTVTVDPPLGSGQKLEFYSSDVDVVRVDVFDGTGWAENPGTCRIEVRCPGAEYVYCDVTVTNNYAVSYFGINPTTGYVKKGGTFNMEWSIYPEEASNTPISWSSSDTNIATIDNTGKITGISEGTVTITAVCGGKTATSQMTVYEDQGGGGEPGDTLELDKEEITLNPGETYTLTVTQYPEGTGADDVIWDTDNADVATVENGVITAHKMGVTYISATIGDYQAWCKVTVPGSGGSGGLDPVIDEPLN